MKQAGLWVLVGASGTMPAVLVEVGFISNPSEERDLRDAAIQRRIADGLADGLLEYHDYVRSQFRSAETETSRE